MRREIKIVTCLVFFYLILSSPFTFNITFGKEIKASCDAVRAIEAEKWPTVVYCQKPVGPGGPNNDLYYFFVYVSGINGSGGIPYITLQARGISGSDRAISSEDYIIENLFPTSEPIAYWENPEAEPEWQRIKVTSNGAFILEGPYDILELTGDYYGPYTRLSPIENCTQLILAATALNSQKKAELAMNLSDRSFNFYPALLALPAFQTTSFAYILAAADSEVRATLASLASSPTEKILVVGVDIGGRFVDPWWVPLKISEKEGAEMSLTDWEFFEILDKRYIQKINDGFYDSVLILHNHPYGVLDPDVYVKYGIPPDDYAFLGEGDILVFGNLLNLFKKAYLSRDRLDLAAAAEKVYVGVVAEPYKNVYNFRIWKPLPKSSTEVSNSLRVIYDFDTEDYFYVPQSQIERGLVKEVYYKVIDGSIIISEDPSLIDPRLGELSYIRKRFFYVTEVLRINKEFNYVARKVFSGEATLQNEEYMGRLDYLIDWSETLDDLIGNSELPDSTKTELLDALDYQYDTLLHAHLFGLDKDDVDLGLKMFNANKHVRFAVHKEVPRILEISKDLAESLYEDGLDVSDEFKEILETYASESIDDLEKLGILLKNIEYEVRTKEILGPDYLSDELVYSVDMGLETLTGVAGFVAGFLIGFGIGLSRWGEEWKDFAAYQLGSDFLMTGLSILLDATTTLGFFMVQITILNGLGFTLWLLSSIIYYIEIGIIAFVIGFFIGLIAGIFLFIFFQPPPSCEQDYPRYSFDKVDFWFLEPNYFGVATRRHDNVNYVLYGVKNCKDHVFSVYTDDLSYPTFTEYIQDYPENCYSENGKCFDCNVTVDRPGAGLYFAFAMREDDEGYVCSPRLWHTSERYVWRGDFTPLLVCPSGYSPAISNDDVFSIRVEYYRVDQDPVTGSMGTPYLVSEIYQIPECIQCSYHQEANTYPNYDYLYSLLEEGIIAGFTSPENEGKCDVTCGADSRCHEKSPGDICLSCGLGNEAKCTDECHCKTSWCDGNVLKICKSDGNLKEIDCGINNYTKITEDSRVIEVGYECVDWGDYAECLPYSPYGDLNFDGKVNMRDVARVTAAFGSYPGHERWDREADINRDGRINIEDVAKVARYFGLVYGEKI